MERGRTKERRFGKSFLWAFSGIYHAFRTERNIQVQCFCGLLAIAASVVLKLSVEDWIHVLLLISGVISLEMVNTAVERVVDLVTEDKHPLAKAAKDVAAGAVLFFSILSVVISVFIFWKYIF